MEYQIIASLRKLDLSHQELTDVPSSIAGLKHLRVLDLSYNNLTSIPDFLLELPHLKTLAIGHNAVTSLPLNLATSSVKNLIADYNCIDFILPSSLTGLRKLIISHNRINIGIVRTVLPNLKYLDIRHNPSIIMAGRDKCLPNAKYYYHDSSVSCGLNPEGMQFFK